MRISHSSFVADVEFDAESKSFRCLDVGIGRYLNERATEEGVATDADALALVQREFAGAQAVVEPAAIVEQPEVE